MFVVALFACVQSAIVRTPACLTAPFARPPARPSPSLPCTQSLQQSTSTTACDNSVISVLISLPVNASVTATIEDQVSALKKQLFDLYGGNTQVCQLQEAISTIVRVQQLVVGNRRILQTSPAACQAAAATVPRPVSPYEPPFLACYETQHAASAACAQQHAALPQPAAMTSPFHFPQLP